MPSDSLQQAKTVVRNFHHQFDSAADSALAEVLAAHSPEDYLWRGMRPFYEQVGANAVVDEFWLPLRRAFRSLQRREDIFFAGRNDIDGGETVWVASMGYLAGLFDLPWINIPPTRKLTMLRFAEFHRVEEGKIIETALFCDVIGVMQQAGCYPLPPQTGASLLPPGPRSNDGMVLNAQPEAEGVRTLELVHRMVSDLSVLNQSGNDLCPPALLRQSWHDNMMWFGPAGIGSTYTIERYQEQHQHPFRTQLRDKVFNGHVARISEGSYAGFFGWPNLTNTPRGGFLGLPGNDVRADMRVVDIYRREGDKLAENWVFIDLLHWLSMQGLDLLARLEAS